MSSMNERRSTILRMVTESYIDTAHPVASSWVADRLDLSSATVRNEFSALEDEGYLQQPYTSAGRLPTASGFLTYALSCLPPRRLPARQRRMLEQQLYAADGEGLFSLLAQLASELSGYAVVVHIPADEDLHILEIHLSTLSTQRLLAVIVLENGLVRQLSVDLDPVPSDDVLDDAERNLRQLTLPVGEVREALTSLATTADAELARTLLAVASAWRRLQAPRTFSDGLRRLFAEPESQDPAFLRLVVDQVEAPAEGSASERPDMSVDLDEALARVSTGFEVANSRGRLTLVGPTRMRYPAVMMIAQGLQDAISQTRNHAAP